MASDTKAMRRIRRNLAPATSTHTSACIAREQEDVQSPAATKGVAFRACRSRLPQCSRPSRSSSPHARVAARRHRPRSVEAAVPAAEEGPRSTESGRDKCEQHGRGGARSEGLSPETAAPVTWAVCASPRLWGLAYTIAKRYRLRLQCRAGGSASKRRQPGERRTGIPDDGSLGSPARRRTWNYRGGPRGVLRSESRMSSTRGGHWGRAPRGPWPGQTAWTPRSRRSPRKRGRRPAQSAYRAMPRHGATRCRAARRRSRP